MNEPLKIIIIEDNINDATLIVRQLKKDGLAFTSEIVATRETFENSIEKCKPDIILSDYSLPSFDGSSAFQIKQKKCPDIPFIIISGTIGEDKAVELIKSGVTDFSLKNNLKLLSGKIIRALREIEESNEKKSINRKLVHSESRLKQAQAIAHFGGWELSFATGLALWSEEACIIYGLSLEDNIQSYQAWVSFIHPEDLEYVMKFTKEAQETLSSSSLNHRIIRKDGVVKHVFSKAQFEFNEVGQPVGLIGIVHDVTEIKEAENVLRQSKANLHQIVDLIPPSIFAMDGDGKFVFVNKSFAELYGLSPKQLVNKTIYETIPDKTLSDHFVEQAREVINTGDTKIIPEVTFTDYSGKVRTFYSTKVPFDLAGKNEKAMLGISLDITEQKKADIERLKMIADIVQRNKDLEQFSYILSHNLRGPVSTALGIGNLLKTEKLSLAEKIEMVLGLSSSIEKLDEVIRDINKILQIKNHISINNENQIVKLSEILNNVKIILFQYIKDNDVEIKCDFSEIDELFTVKSYMESILYNLISNSIKYRRIDVKPIIEITSLKHDHKIELKVCDNGLGIDLEKNSQNVFALYKRFHYHVDGKGLGLFMVKTQVESMGGKIFIESEVNVGTKFKIVFENIEK